MALFNFNAAAIEPQQRSYDPLPAGEYELMVVRSELKDTQSGTGQFIKLEMHVVSGDHAGRRVWENLNISNPNKQAEDIAQQQLASLCLAVGVKNLEDTEQLHDRPFIASIAIDRKDPTRNRVMGYKSATAASAKPAAPKPAAKPEAKPASGRPW